MQIDISVLVSMASIWRFWLYLPRLKAIDNVDGMYWKRLARSTWITYSYTPMPIYERQNCPFLYKLISLCWRQWHQFGVFWPYLPRLKAIDDINDIYWKLLARSTWITCCYVARNYKPGKIVFFYANWYLCAGVHGINLAFFDHISPVWRL